MFTNKMKANVTSVKKNHYAQIYSTDFGWTKPYPIPNHLDIHQLLTDLFPNYGVTLLMIMDSAKEQISGEFCLKLKKA